MRLTQTFLMWETDLVLRHAQKSRRRQLRQELATYTTQGDRQELAAILARYRDSDTQQLRRDIAWQPAHSNRAAGGMRPPASCG